MSVLCCRVPNFLMGLAYRHQPKLIGRPLALLGPDERVWAVAPEARLSGVCVQMHARQAQMRCPDLMLRPLEIQTCQAEQSALLGTLAQSGLPVEASTWGMAYVDLHTVAHTAQAVRPLCAQLGLQLQRLLGQSLQPALGWDTGKFTARVAASYAKPGHMRLVDRADETHFLKPRPITLLPLPPLSLQQLDWLGIRTLGQFARLPAAAVWQRFGQAGQLAQQWAQGQDRRPVRSTVQAVPQPIEVEFEPPTALHGNVLEATLAALHPHLLALAERLEGCRRLRLELRFSAGSTRLIDCAWIEPVSDGPRLRAMLAHQLHSLNWPGELNRLRVTLLESGELLARQLTFFPMDEGRSQLLEIAQRLSGRYGPLFFQALVTDERHPLAERRARFNAFSSCASLENRADLPGL